MLTYFHVSAYLGTNPAQNTKTATSIKLSFPLTFFLDKLDDFYFKLIKVNFHERLITKFLMALRNS